MHQDSELRVATGDELTVAELYAILRLRVDVFVVEQEAAYPELDGKDLLPSTTHLWLPDAGGVAGYLRVLDEPGDLLRIGRVCTAKQARGGGLAARLMTRAMDLVGGRESALDAQTYVAGFYGRYGFRPSGPEYTDDDGIPHVPMRRAADLR